MLVQPWAFRTRILPVQFVWAQIDRNTRLAYDVSKILATTRLSNKPTTNFGAIRRLNSRTLYLWCSLSSLSARQISRCASDIEYPRAITRASVSARDSQSGTYAILRRVAHAITRGAWRNAPPHATATSSEQRSQIMPFGIDWAKVSRVRARTVYQRLSNSLVLLGDGRKSRYRIPRGRNSKRNAA